MTRKNELEFASFVCRFGSDDMPKYLNEIVLPALLAERPRTIRRSTTYHFLDGAVHPVGTESEPYNVVSFKFVREGVLRREKVLEGRELLDDPATMPDACFGFVALILENHRLIYYPATVRSPRLKTFKTICEWRLKKARDDYILSRSREEKSDEAKVDAEYRLRREIPVPTLEVIPIAGRQELTSTLKTFEVLRKITIRLAKTNGEIDNNDFFKKMRSNHERLNSVNSTLTYVNGKSGLDIDEASSQLGRATQQGTVDVKLEGAAEDGTSMEASNDTFKFSTYADIALDSVRDATSSLVSKFKDEIEKGNIPRPTMKSEYVQQIREKVAAFFRDL